MAQTRANDTLTRAQVYNFNIGDTFDYANYDHYWDHQYIDTTFTNYYRKVISHIYYSLDSSTKYIERTTVYPLPITKDTLTLTNLHDCELCLDTSNYFNPCTLTFNSPPMFNGQTVNNIIVWQGGPPEPYQRFFATALGEVMDVNDGSYLGGEVGQIDTVQLIYYADSLSTWGTPFYLLATGINEPPGNEPIVLYPCPSNGNFTLSLSAYTSPVSLLIYDMVGNVVYQKTITAYITTFDIRACGSGLYFWKIIGQKEILGSGKVAVQ